MTTDAITLVLSLLLAAAFLAAGVVLLRLAVPLARARARRAADTARSARSGRSLHWPARVPGSAGGDADLARVLHDLEAVRSHRAA